VNRLLQASLVSSLLLPVICAAQEGNQPTTPFSYSYAEITYAETELEVAGSDLDGDGFAISGSYELNDDWHVFGGIGNTDLDFNIDLDSWVIGAGYRYPLQDDLDVYGRVMFLTMDVDLPGPFDPDDDGLGLQVRLRHRLNEEFELEGGLQYLDIADSDTSLQAEGRYYFEDSFSVGIGLTFGGDTDGLGISARYSF
jgi:hypothetical protein